MDEAKRIIRFILPGMVYIILILVTLVILNFDDAKEIFSLFKDASFGGFLTIFVFSGGLGYIFSIIYFGYIWVIGEKRKSHIYNFLDLLKNLIASNKLQIVKLNDSGEEEVFQIKSKRDAFYIMNALWHGESKKSGTIEAVSKKFDSYLSDITTGLGTTLTATLFSFITSLVLFFKYYNNSNCGLVLGCATIYVIFFYLVFLSHKRTYKMYQAIVNTTLATEMFKEGRDVKTSIKIIFSE